MPTLAEVLMNTGKMRALEDRQVPKYYVSDEDVIDALFEYIDADEFAPLPPPAPVFWLEFKSEREGYACGALVKQGNPECTMFEIVAAIPYKRSISFTVIYVQQHPEHGDKWGVGVPAGTDMSALTDDERAFARHLGIMVTSFMRLLQDPTRQLIGTDYEYTQGQVSKAKKRKRKLPEMTRISLTAPYREPNADSTHTGTKKCRHFVRSFLRIRRGKPELVRAHWRGDETLGVRDPEFAVSA